MKPVHTWIFFIYLILFSYNFSFADYESYPKTRFDLRHHLYTGLRGSSFEEQGSSFGLGVTKMMNRSFLVPTFSFAVIGTSGRQTFNDNGSDVEAGFNYYAANADFSIQLYLLGRRTTGINVYLTGGGLVGYNYIALSKDITTTYIPYTDQSISTGYLTGAGAEFILGTNSPNKWTIFSQITLKNESAILLKQKFDLNSIIFSAGIGW